MLKTAKIGPKKPTNGSRPKANSNIIGEFRECKSYLSYFIPNLCCILGMVISDLGHGDKQPNKQSSEATASLLHRPSKLLQKHFLMNYRQINSQSSGKTKNVYFRALPESPNQRRMQINIDYICFDFCPLCVFICVLKLPA